MADEFDDDLRNPDESDERSAFSWDEDFQRHIISLLLCDRSFLLQALDLVKPGYFTNRAHQKACSILFKYFREHRTLPVKTFILQEMKIDLKDNKSLPAFIAEINVLYDYFHPGLDARDYLTSKIQYFAKMQAFRKAFQDGLKLLDQNPESEENWQKIYDKIETVITTSANFEVGCDYFKSVKDRYVAMEEEDGKLVFPTGFTTLDLNIKGGGHIAGEIISIVAGSGVGKSLALANFARQWLLRGKKGVYFTLELAESKVAERMDAVLTGFPIQNLYSHKDDIFERLASLKGVDYDSMMPLVIKQFPSGQASVNTLRAYLSQLRFHNYKPDFAIIDYVGEMQDYPGIPTHESREKIVRDLRGMASEEGIHIATAMQPNRDYKKDQQSGRTRIDDDHLAGSFGQIRPLDGCYSINQNDTEKELGIARLYVMKERDGKSRYQIYISIDKENLRMQEISAEAYREKLSCRKEYVSDDVKIDMIMQQNMEDEPLPPKNDDDDDDDGEMSTILK